MKLSVLIELDLSNQNSQLKGGAIERLCAGLKNQTSLHKLNVSRNNIGVLGVGAMANLVSDPRCSLFALGMAWTELNGAEGTRFFEGLGHNKSLKTLDISYNSLGGGVGGVGASHSLAEALRRNKTLTHLDISYNHFGEVS